MKQNNKKFNNAMHKFVGVLDMYEKYPPTSIIFGGSVTKNNRSWANITTESIYHYCKHSDTANKDI